MPTSYLVLSRVASFIFTLQEFARELVSLLDAMGRIYALERQQHAVQPWWARIWAKPWSFHSGAGFPDPPRQNSKKKPGLRRHICMRPRPLYRNNGF
jgi:hypothetical protein